MTEFDSGFWRCEGIEKQSSFFPALSKPSRASKFFTVKVYPESVASEESVESEESADSNVSTRIGKPDNEQKSEDDLGFRAWHKILILGTALVVTFGVTFAIAWRLKKKHGEDEMHQKLQMEKQSNEDDSIFSSDVHQNASEKAKEILGTTMSYVKSKRVF